jgi:DNA-binding transcriptional MocR family regulator
LPDDAPAADVLRDLFRQGIVCVPGEHFYVDRGGTHELRLCFSAHPPDKGVQAVRALARSIDEVQRRGAAEAPLLAIP